MTKPIISNRDKLLSVSVFPQTYTDDRGKTHEGFSMSLQRSYQTKEQKGTDNYERQKISLFPEEALRFAELLCRTYSDFLTYVQMNKQASANYQAQSTNIAPEQVEDNSIDF
jgi:hypothetical protein